MNFRLPVKDVTVVGAIGVDAFTNGVNYSLSALLFLGAVTLALLDVLKDCNKGVDL